MNKALKNLYVNLRYVLGVYCYLPITFIKRVIFCRDPYWNQFFWSRWGFLPREVLREAKRKKTIWIVALAGGEVTQMFTFSKLLHQVFPDYYLIASVNDYKPLMALKKVKEIDYVFDQPWDLNSVTKRVLRKIKPCALIFVENPHFPKLLKNAFNFKIPTILVSGFMSKNWPRHQTVVRLMTSNFYQHLQYIGVKEGADAEGYRKLGANPERIKVVGNMKFDLDYLTLSQSEKDDFYKELGLNKDDFVLLGGSLLGIEGRIVIDAYNVIRRSFPRAKLIFVPRYNDIIPEAESRLDELNIKWIRRSCINALMKNGFAAVLVDTFGELNRMYALASVIFIGGGIVKTSNLAYGKNIIEPLVQKKPVFFGPNMNHWVEITAQLKEIYPPLEVRNAEELSEGVIRLFQNERVLASLEMKALEIIGANRDAVRNNVQFVTEIINSRCK